MIQTTNTDTEKFKQFLLEGKTGQAQAWLKEFFRNATASGKKGAALLTLTSLYMEVENTLNREHLKILEQGINELQGLSKQDRELADKLDLAKLRKGLV